MPGTNTIRRWHIRHERLRRHREAGIQGIAQGRAPGKIGRSHRVNKAESIAFMKDRYGISLDVKEE
jgi:hypothetical protein